MIGKCGTCGTSSVELPVAAAKHSNVKVQFNFRDLDRLMNKLNQIHVSVRPATGECCYRIFGMTKKCSLDRHPKRYTMAQNVFELIWPVRENPNSCISERS